MANIYVRSTDGSDVDDGSTWALAKATLVGALAIATASDTIWVSDAHAETQASAMTLTYPTTVGLRVLCGDDAAEPPTALATTATITTTGSNNMLINTGHHYTYGISFNAATGAGNNQLTFGSTLGSGMFFEKCKFALVATGATAIIRIGFSANAGLDDNLFWFKDCTWKFAATGHSIKLAFGRIVFQGLTIDGAGATPTSLFSFAGNATESSLTLVEASDLSGESFTNLVSSCNVGNPSVLVVRNCKLPASVTIVGTANTTGPGGPVVKVHNCDSADTNYRIAEHYFEGITTSETTLVRTGGSSDGTTTFSYKMVSSANSKFWDPLIGPELFCWNETVGSVTATVEILHDSATNLQDDEIWLEVMTLNTSGFPQGTLSSDRMTNILSTPADQTASSETWTTTGMTNPNKQKLSVTFTTAEKGVIVGRVMLANPSYTVYIDPTMSIQTGREFLVPGYGVANQEATGGSTRGRIIGG